MQFFKLQCQCNSPQNHIASRSLAVARPLALSSIEKNWLRYRNRALARYVSVKPEHANDQKK